MAKKKKGKSKQKKNLNKVVRLDGYREKELEEDLDHFSIEELEDLTAAGLRHALEEGGDTSGTVHWLKEAISLMQYYDRRQGKHQPLPAEWVVLVEEMMKLTSLLGENDMVLEIYRTLGRLCKGGIPHHLAGIAAFNLKEYAFAAKCWEKMSRAGNDPEVLVYTKIAKQADQGIIPPFSIDYEEESWFLKMRDDQIQGVMALGDLQKEKKHQMAAAHIKEITKHLERGVGRFTMLVEFYEAVEDGFIQQASFLADVLLINTGAWGLQLFRNLAQDTQLPQELRDEMRHMLDSEAIVPAEEITLYGQPFKVLFEDKRLKATWDMAKELRRRKRDDEAKDMILQAMNRKKATSPELVMQLAAIEGAKGQWQVTLDLMVELAKAMPGDLAVLYNQVLSYSKLQKWEAALSVLEGMKLVVEVEEAAGAEVASHYSSKALESLEKSILRDRGLVEGIQNVAKNSGWNYTARHGVLSLLTGKELKGMVEAKNLPKNTSLLRGMKNMPVEWVSFACKQHNLQVDGLREDMEKALVEALVSEATVKSAESSEVLKKALEALDPSEQEVLQYLLKKGGTAGTGYLVRKHGSMEEDDYFWEEGNAPKSTLGRLWSKCLVMVGRGLVNGKRQKVALIPTDLLPQMKKHFKILGK